MGFNYLFNKWCWDKGRSNIKQMNKIIYKTSAQGNNEYICRGYNLWKKTREKLYNLIKQIIVMKQNP